MSNDEENWQELIRGLRNGVQRVVQQFCEQYGGELHHLAEKHLGGALRRRVGPEDVVQSACRTFFRRAQAGEFQLADSESIWRLLCAITLTKVREQARYHLRKKRGLAQEASLPSNVSAAAMQPVDRAPSPSAAVAFADQFEHVLESLDEEERRVVDLKLQEHTNDQVAELMGCSERTVRRILKRLQSRLEKEFEVA